MLRDKMDFGSMKVGQLFVRQLVPNVFGMIFTALFIITDGIFVGRGIGSDALAAVNIAAPMSLFMTGVGLMFGMGGAIVASVNKAKGKLRVANINVTQTIIITSIFMLLVSLFVCLFPTLLAGWMGAPDNILRAASGYLFYYGLFGIFQSLLCTLPFFIRMINPVASMLCLITGTILNIVLDYLFIFVFRWGLAGAAIATGIGEIVAVTMMFIYLFRQEDDIRLVRLKTSVKSVLLTLRNTGYIVRLGVSAFLSEVTIALMMITGNYAFARYLGVDGVAAYSIICYLFPVIFMVFNAIIQSAQPIISFSHEKGDNGKAIKAMRMALTSAVTVGALFMLVSWIWKEPVISLFISDLANPARNIAIPGLPLFAIDFIFFGINIVAAGYYMCVEDAKIAIQFTIIRGILPVISFLLLPLALGIPGVWLAVPVAEMLTTSWIVLTVMRNKIQPVMEVLPG